MYSNRSYWKSKWSN